MVSFKESHVKIFNTGKLEIPGIQESLFNKILDTLVSYYNLIFKSFME